MARVTKGGHAQAKHKKIVKQAKGYRGARSKLFRTANQAVTRASQYAYIGRKQKKRTFRALWIQRLNAAARAQGLTYSRLMDGLKKAEIDLDRKVLSDLAIREPEAFDALVSQAKSALEKAEAERAKAA